MKMNNIMDLGGSQSTNKATSRGTKSTSKDRAASSDLFKSIIGQKQAGSQKQSGLDIQQSPAQQQKPASKPAQNSQQTQGSKDSSVQDTSSNKDSAPVQGNDSAPADNLDETTAVEDAAAEGVAAGQPEDGETVTEDETTIIEEAPADEAEEITDEETDAPRQIFLMQMPVAAAAATIAPVIISSETYQASTVETIVNDVTLDQLPTEPQVLVQMTEAEVVVTPNHVEADVSQFTALMDAQPAAQEVQPQQGQQPAVQQGQDAAVQLTGELQEVAAVQTETPAEPQEQTVTAQPQQQQQVQAAPTQGQEQQQPVLTDAEQEAPQPLRDDAAPEENVQNAAPAEEQQTPVHAAAQQPDAADDFAAQVVKEAKDLVREAAAEPAHEVQAGKAEIDRPVEAKADADDTEDAAGKGSEQQKAATQTTMPGTAPVAEDGHVDLRANAAQPLEAEQYLQPETRQMILNRVVDQVRSAVSPDRTEFYIQLKPDFLGGLSIGLVAEEKGIVAKIMTSSQQVHSVLQADMTALQRVLQERGINVVEMEVIYNQMADTTSKDNSDNRQQQFSQGGNNRSHGRISEQTDDALTMYDTLSTYDVLTENGGSVEFTA